MGDSDPLLYKQCAHCKESKVVTEFLRRTGQRSSPGARRGTCRDCRKRLEKSTNIESSDVMEPLSAALAPNALYGQASVKVKHQQSPSVLTAQFPDDSVYLKTTRQGMIWMRGRTDKGRRWHQEIELELAVTLVKERAAVLVNRHTIRRLFSNKDFRKHILERDNHTCYFCGEFGDTIDHMLPRAKGGHTTPDNCVCACNACNQSKADKDVDTFMRSD